MVKQPDNPFMEWWFATVTVISPENGRAWIRVIISEDGYIVTNNHVIENAENIEVKLNDNRILSAEVIGRDPTTDIALLKVNVNNLQYLRWGDSEKLKVGEWVLAVGNPFTLGTTVTAGIVSAKGRNLDILEGEYRIESFIQTDAALNAGNSGGALVDTKGLLVGITSAIYSPSGAYAGNSFAIPVSIVRKVVDDLKEYGEVQRAIIGVLITDMTSEEAKKLNMKEVKGASFQRFMTVGAAPEANLKENDVYLRQQKRRYTSAELQEQVAKYRPGDKISITYLRGGKEFTVPVILKNIAGNTNVVTRGMTGMEVFEPGLKDFLQRKRDHINSKTVSGLQNWVKDCSRT